MTDMKCVLTIWSIFLLLPLLLMNYSSIRFRKIILQIPVDDARLIPFLPFVEVKLGGRHSFDGARLSMVEYASVTGWVGVLSGTVSQFSFPMVDHQASLVTKATASDERGVIAHLNGFG
ncbi:hypothetical protein C8R44DRAFT_744669 [Mycena epipterygia]|nr:hypothetical protein C8R44DRAFT_744669 [Mycena epipterygia]